VGGNGTILKTINGGINWISQNSGLTAELRSVTFINDSIGWAVGDSGKIISTGHFGVTGIVFENSQIPSGYSVSQNYPNPFNPSTKINFSIPRSSLVKISVYDLTGRIAGIPVNEFLSAGTYQFTWNAGNLTSGVYFYRLDAEGFTDTKKMILVK
jgi:hypothetical protein